MSPLVITLVLTAIALWALVAFAVAAIIGRTAAAGEHQHEMDGLYRSQRWGA